MLIWASRDRLTPAVEVTVVPVVTTRGEVKTSESPLFQAPGWIEPRPRAVVVSALSEGVIERLMVVEGQEVRQGDPVALLIDVDAKLALEQARNERQQRLAQLDMAKAEHEAALTRLENPSHLDAQAAEAESMLTRVQTERAKLPSLVESAQIRLRFAEQDLAGKQEAQDAVSQRLIQQANSQRDAALTELNELTARGPLLDREIAALEKRAESLRLQRRLLVDEKLRVADSRAKIQLAEAMLKQAEVSIAVAQVGLDRTKVTAPISGRVLQVVARPGTRVMGLSPTSAQESATIATLYDPALLQVRTDVRLEDVPNVFPGQRVRIETASAKETLTGHVVLVTSAANIQKNTLEVKVGIDEPPATIRPEMLARVTFISPAIESSSASEQTRERILAPRSLLLRQGDQTSVWLVDAESKSQMRSVRVGLPVEGGLIEVVEGLNPTDRLISSDRDGLTNSSRVRIAREDSVLGTESETTGKD
jgi:multidrug efflux pump subunit AcrA (membrane-fusion protein)